MIITPNGFTAHHTIFRGAACAAQPAGVTLEQLHLAHASHT